MQEFKAIDLEEAQNQTSEVLKPSLYPITNWTDFALKRINCSALSQKLSISFEDKRLIPWTCGHEKYAFHRGYQYISNDPQKWSQSFKLVMRLSCIELNCKTENLINILKFMEKRFFGKPRDL